MADAPDLPLRTAAAGEPLDAALADLERRRRDRWLVVILLIVAAIAAVVLLGLDVAGTSAGAGFSPSVGGAAAAFLAVTLLYGGWVALEERRARRVLRALIRERERTAALTARVSALDALQATVRDVAAADDLVAVFERLLSGALQLTGATSGAVLLDAAGALTVAASTGPDAPGLGASLPRSGGPVASAVTRGEPVLSGRGASWGTSTQSSSIATPLRLPDRIVGALVVVRGSSAPAFHDADVAVVALFAAHAALALRNAWRLEAQREDVTGSLDERDDLLESATARADAITGIVHDLRAPLTSIGGYVQLLRSSDELLTPQRRSAVLNDVGTEVVRLRGLVDDLLTVAVTEAGVHRAPAAVDLAALAREAARLGRGVLASYDEDPAQLTVDAPGPAVVRGDSAALERVIANLLENAVVHTPRGTRIELTVTRADGEVRLGVRDHGRGIDPALAEVAFGAFVTGPDGGSGFGLHVVRTVVEAHGGRVSLRPAEGGGTLAEVVFPENGAA